MLFHLIAKLFKERNNNTLICQGICSASNSAISETANDLFLHSEAILILRFITEPGHMIMLFQSSVSP